MKHGVFIFSMLLMGHAMAEETFGEGIVAADLFYSSQQKARLFAKHQVMPDSTEQKATSLGGESVIEGVWRNRKGYHAMIGGKIFDVGQTVGGARIARIDKQFVEFDLSDAPPFYLRVGERFDLTSRSEGGAP